MKHLFSILLLGCTLLSVAPCMADSKDKTNPSADRYNVTDSEGMLAFGKSYYELNGRPSGANGNFYSTSNASWSIKGWPDSNKHIATYLHFPKCKSNARIQLTTTGTVKLLLVVTNMQDGSELLSQEISIAKGSKQWIDLFDATDFPESAWYKFDLQCTKGASYVGEFFYWQFQKTGSTEKIYTADYMSSPSVHLSGWKTTDPTAPAAAQYDWAYQEVMVPESSAVVGTYCMSLGILHGYMGIQIDSDKDYPIIFSMWDNGSTDEDPNLPAYLRSGALDWEKGVTIARFANEGTGAQAKYRTGKNWIPGKWVKFITNARPEIVNVEIDDPAHPGQKKTITYTNTLCSAWFLAEGLDDDWHYIATIRQSGANNYFDGWYSFLENYNWPTGQWQRKAYYRNGGLHSLANGRWYHANSVGFGHTDGGTKYGDRRDYGQGQTEDFDNCFFMSTGGYHEEPVQNSKVVPLIRNFMPVDQATLDRLTARVDEAIRREQVLAMKEDVDNACEIYAQSRFTVVNKSDEATNEGAANLATAVVDGNESTYWHSKWSGTEAPYPHWLVLKVDSPEDIRIGQITLLQKRESRYRAKTMTIATSTDNVNWTTGETVVFDDAERPTVALSTPISAPYIKLTFKNGYGTNLLYINEIYFKSAPSLDDLKKKAAEVLAMANQFGGYSSADLQNLSATYADGTCTDYDVLSKALNDLAATGQPLKFGRVDAMKNVSSFKAYQLHSLDRKGELIATADGKALCTGEGNAINVVDPLCNWLLVYSSKTQQYYAYNLGAEKFLKAGGGSYSLTEEPTPIVLTYTMGGFRLGTSDTWELRDNYVAMPPYEVPVSIVEKIDYAADASLRQQKYNDAAAFLAYAKADAQLDFDSKYAGVYDTTPLEELLAKGGATVDEVAAAYDKVAASALPKAGYYYRLANALRPTKNAKSNYLALSGAEKNWEFIAHNSTVIGPAPTNSSLAENFRTYRLDRADNDSTFYIFCPATNTYVMTQNTDRGNSAAATPLLLTYSGKRLFRLQSGNKYLAVNTSYTLAETSTKDESSLFYLEEVTTLPKAVSTDDSGYGTTCLPLPIALPANMEAYIATSITDGKLIIEPLNAYLDENHQNYLPAHLPVVLHSTNEAAISATACVILDSDIPCEAATKANILCGKPYRMTITKSDYVFASPANSLKKSASVGLTANKLYLPAAIIPEGFSGNIGMEITAIGSIVTPTERGTERIYDLQGRPIESTVATPSGIYIKSGRSLLAK